MRQLLEVVKQLAVVAAVAVQAAAGGKAATPM
jgi:hypothetical protein